jgi:hypothetical protein
MIKTFPIFIGIIFCFSNGKSQKFDTLKLERKKYIIFTKPDKLHLDSLMQVNSIELMKIENEYLNYIQPLIDSANKYDIQIIYTDARYIFFPFESKNLTGYITPKIIDREILARENLESLDISEQRLWGVFWYGGRNDEIHWGYKYPWRMSMKQYFFRK